MNAPLLRLSITAGYPKKPRVLDGLKLDVHEGEILGLVGGSGEGKSTITMAILGMLDRKGGHVSGEVRFRGQDLTKLSERQLRPIRGQHIALIPQSPLACLNPCLRLKTHLREFWRAHKRGTRDFETLLESVSLPSSGEFLNKYPRHLSVGMAQRFLIAAALLHDPPLLLADEPTSALDMITQAEILRLFRQLNRERGIAMLYISHDLPSVASICHRVAILYRGRIVESGNTADLFRSARHPYTQTLLSAIPTSPLIAEKYQR